LSVSTGYINYKGGVSVLEPLGFFLGAATFGLAAKFKDPLRKLAVFSTVQLISVMEGLKTTAYNLKEEVEDIVAEAHYENMKKNSNTLAEESQEYDDE
jgi:hypothetical protein